MTVAYRRLDGVVQSTALLLVVAGLLVATGAAGAVVTGLAVPRLPSAAWLAAAVLAVTAAQLARLRLRVATASVNVAWGEAAIVILCALCPPAWIPAVVAAGAALAMLLHRLFDPARTWAGIRRTVAALTVSGAAAAAVSALVLGVAPTAFPPPTLTPRLVAAVCSGAVTYALVSGWLAAVGVARQVGGGVGTALVRTLRGKSPMYVGNVGVGLLVVFLYRSAPHWLLLLPPAVWLLHQTYAYRVRGDDERHAWQLFTDATRGLSRLEGYGIAFEGVRGVLRLFPAPVAELVLPLPDGGVRSYRLERLGEIVERDGADPAGPADTVRQLTIGTAAVGELRLPGTTLTGRELLVFAAYGDALAAALHDAATHHELRAMTERSSYEAAHDTVTGVPNRRGFLTAGEAHLRELEPDAPVGLLLLDIDHFKNVNDTLGHAAGDQVIRMVAGRLAGVLAEGEVLARLGGDEFGVLITRLPADGEGAGRVSALAPGVPAGHATAEYPLQLGHALARAQLFAREVATPARVAGVRLSVEASVGVAVTAAGGAGMAELLRRADVAMYQAKRGGGTVAWYDAARDEASTDRLALLAELREALNVDDQLSLVLQPAVDLVTGAATGVEALVRWRHPRRGDLLPGEFVPIVEHSELIGPFTRYVLDRALVAAAQWRAAGLDIPVAVNLSARSLLDPVLPQQVAELLAKHRIPAGRLVLEITETVVVSDLPVTDRVLAALRRLGVQLAVDDFGTGYSSLTFLTRVPVDEVKVDRDFVARMVESPEAAAIVRTTVQLGRELGLRVVAEGVETAEQRAALAALGCTAVQGFHICPPLPAERIVAMLSSLSSATVIRLATEETG
jgi:predicted signal transduction protein with EAL and GGDEF domain